jgi:adenosylcobyric acid synthase
VLLVGDIDRGGVFAQLVGTMMLLEPAERRRVKATVANKFRGDPTLFDEGIRILEEKTGVPVAGLVPYIQVDLDDEDSVSDRLERREHAGLVDVAVVRLPKISNFTDFNALEATGVACVRYVSEPQELGTPDLVVLPGTKATMADLAWLRSTGFDKAVGDAAQIGIPVLGICGGYQMLGLSISDPCGVEGGGETDGLGLLPIRTVFGTKKRTVRSRGRYLRAEGPLEGLSGMRVDGYEIHMGTTRLEGGSALVELIEADGTRRLEGCQTGNVYGCYLHGLFDDSQANRGLLQSLMSAKGLDGAEACAVDMKAYREGQYDMLAACIRAHLNMELIYEIIEKGAS